MTFSEPLNFNLTPFHFIDLFKITNGFFVFFHFHVGTTPSQKGFEIIFNVAFIPVANTLILSMSRLILTTVLITSKMFNDTYYTNQFIAQVGGVSLANINELERFFMSMIDWNLFIKPEEFEQYEKGLEMFQGHEATQ